MNNLRDINTTKAKSPSQNEIQYLSLLFSQKQFNKTLFMVNQMLKSFPKSITLLNIKATTFSSLKEFEEAIDCYKQALTINPNFYVAYNNLAITQYNKGDLDNAILNFHNAIDINPNYVDAFNNKALALRKRGDFNLALNDCEYVIKICPQNAKAYNYKGLILSETNKFKDAIDNYRQAIILDPNYSDAFNNLGVSLQKLGKFEEAEACYRQAINIKPDYIECYSNLLYLISISNFSYQNYLKDASSYVTRIRDQTTLSFSKWSYVYQPKRLRIGFVSGDYKNHPVGYFLESLLSQLSSSSLDIYAYTTTFIEDDLTSRIKSHVTHWRQLHDKSDDQAAQLIHNDNIHILIDLSGHTDLNRLPIFVSKPAPIQVSWLGYWASTGLTEIDYILGDPFITPYDEAHHFSEKIWQLPESYFCFTEPNFPMKVKSLPALQTGEITFGCFNKLLKMTDEMVSLRAKILNRIPSSKLFLKDNQLQYASVRDQVISRYKNHGISAERLLLEGPSERSEYLECYNRVDIVLSPYPYGGLTTNIEALWMGVPAIIKRGDYLLSHLGETIANNAGIPDWIAVDEDDYIKKAIQFSSNLEDLVRLRKGLRTQLQNSSLLNPEKFSEHFESALWSMWSKWQSLNKNKI